MANHLTLEEREVIAQMRSAGRDQAEIARRLKRAASTISRELGRNRSSNGYWAVAAETKAEIRRNQRPRVCKLQQPAVRRYVQGSSLSPVLVADEIAGLRARIFPAIAHGTFRTRRSTHGSAPGRGTTGGAARAGGVPRHEIAGGFPPAPASTAVRPWWIAVAVTATGRVTRWSEKVAAAAVTLVERKSGYVLLGRVGNLQAATVRRSATDLYGSTPPALRKTLTLDNGKEFAEHQQLAADAELKIYFARAYCAWQRRYERKHQWPDPPVLSQGHGFGHRSRTPVHQSPTTPEQPPPKTSRLPNAPRNTRITTESCD